MAPKNDIQARVNRQMTPENGIKITQLVVRPITRRSQDIGSWRIALQQAEGVVESRVALYDLYEDIALDGVLKSLMGKRILGVTKKELLFVDKNNEPVEGMQQLLKSSVIRNLRKEIQLQKFWGVKVIELYKQQNTLQFYSVPVKHIKPKAGLITKEQMGNDGFWYREPPISNYVFEVGKYDDLGLLLQAAPYVIYKRGGFGDWAQYAEMFGMPFREGKYDGYNQVAKAQLEEALEYMGGAGYAVTPKETEIIIHENRGTQGSSDLYNALRQACNEELAITILGQTETTTKTSGKLGGGDQTHEHTEDAINMDDCADELSIFNEKVLPILRNLGFPVEGGEFKHKEEDEKLTLKEKGDIFVKMKKEYELPMDDDHVYEEMGIPKPKDYDAQKKAKEAAKTAAPEPTPKPQPKPAKKPASAPNSPTLSIELPIEESGLSWFEKIRANLADFFAPGPKD